MNKYKSIIGGKMEHKYLEDLGIQIKNTPWGWCEDNNTRQSQWMKEREEYGFDQRETWSLDTTFFYWLYERVKMYDKVNCINTKFHKFTVNGEELTKQECMDRILLGCEYYFKFKNEGNLELEKIAFQIADEILDIWKQCIFSMWW
jgi:hypothetical protein